MQQNKFRVRYIGPDDIDLRNGDIYQAIELLDCNTMYGIFDRSDECYAYPRELFQKVDAAEFAIGYIKLLRSGDAQPCPECRTGFVSTEYDPKTSHFFRCNECDFMITID